MTTTTEQIVRENPLIEESRLRLLKEAENKAFNVGQPTLASQLPAYQVAGFSPQQQAAIDAATMQGIGAYSPYIDAANTALGAGYNTTAEAADLLRGADTRAQFADAQTAMNRAAAATGNMSQGIGAVGMGLGQLGMAQQRALASDTTGQFGGAYSDLRQGSRALQSGQNMLNRYQQADLSSADQALGDAYGAARLAGPSNFAQENAQLGRASSAGQRAAGMASAAAQQGGFGRGIADLRLGAQQAASAARGLRNAPTAEAAQTGYRPNLTAYGMGPVRDVSGIPQVGIGGITAARLEGAPQLETFQMGPAREITTRSFTGDAAQQYMSPYMQGVVGIQQREAQRQADIARTQRAAQAVGAGAFGGSRQAVMEAEAQRNLATQLGDIQATGLQQAYQQGQQQFNTEQQARLAAEQANQAAGLTVGQQNLAAQLGVQQLREGQINLQTNLANLSNEQQARVQSEAFRLQAQGMNQQAAMQQAMANQQRDLAVEQQNLASQLGVQQLGAQQMQQADLANTANRQQAALANQALQGQYGLAGQQAQLQAAQMQQNVGTSQLNAATQQGQLGLQAAAQAFQSAGLDAQTAMQMAQLDQIRQQQAAQQSQLYSGIGQLRGQQALQQAQLGQSAAGQTMQGANIYGQLAGQRGQLASQESAIGQNISNLLAQQAGQYGAMGGQLANIYGQQGAQYQNIGQGIGQLAGQQFNIGQSMSQGLGQLGAQLGQLGIQQAALGQTEQAMNQSDINLLYGLGQSQQALNQQVLDATRASELQKIYAPYQQLGFLSDIYRGTPSSQSAVTTAASPQASPFQQFAGTAVGGLAAFSGAKKAGLV